MTLRRNIIVNLKGAATYLSVSMEALTDVQLIGALSCRRASYSRPPPSLRLQHPQRVQVPPLTSANAGDESRELARFGEGG